jgi:hypothetical protein
MAEVAATLRHQGIFVEVSEPGRPSEPMAPADTRFHHSYAVWSKFPRKKGDRDSSIWRVEEFLGLDRGRARGDRSGRRGRTSGRNRRTGRSRSRDPRRRRPGIPRGAGALAGGAPSGGARRPGRGHSKESARPWVMLKMTCPVASGDLWRRLLRDHAGRLVVVMTLNDLRLSDVKISRELSWERIAGDLARELVRHPRSTG